MTPRPTINFDYQGKHYSFPFKEGCNAGITVREGLPPLYGGYTEQELYDLVEESSQPADGDDGLNRLLLDSGFRYIDYDEATFTGTLSDLEQAIRTKYINREELKAILNHHTLESHKKLRRELGLEGEKK